ncbi:MAG TPA: hypothetical protein VMQ61_14935 [Thermoanaerobaculia bacterium]|nr:hypothetical protein [Thermoanaerobaculia bacterium]
MTIRAKFEDVISLGPDEIPKGSYQQGGVGFYSLCGRCNNQTGHWYGSAFVAWCYQGMDIMLRSGGNPALVHLHYLFPLRIIKQLAVMFFSINSEGFHTVNQELVGFVLNRDRIGLSPRYRFFVYYNTTGRLRYAAGTGVVQLGDGFRSGRSTVVSEITYPPFGYLMTHGDDPPDDRPLEITFFAKYDYKEFAVLDLKVPALPVHLFYPGDYRTRDQILEQGRKSAELETTERNPAERHRE